MPPEVWCFRYVFGVQISPHKVFGRLGIYHLELVPKLPIILCSLFFTEVGKCGDELSTTFCFEIGDGKPWCRRHLFKVVMK